jgi:hypothetical protein
MALRVVRLFLLLRHLWLLALVAEVLLAGLCRQ